VQFAADFAGNVRMQLQRDGRRQNLDLDGSYI